jgi:hypothetical protein
MLPPSSVMLLPLQLRIRWWRFFCSTHHLLAVALLGQQLDGACIARDAAIKQAASAFSVANQAIITRGALEVDL